MDGIWFLYLMLGAFPALIAFAAIYKYFEVVQASRWPSVPGQDCCIDHGGSSREFWRAAIGRHGTP